VREPTRGDGPVEVATDPMSAWRHARAIVLLPGMVALVVPALILLLGNGASVGWGLESPWAVLPVVTGLALIAAGLALWTWTVRLFDRIGKGTLAPWDPTRHLVVEGPYAHVRNPMITAVLAVLLGEAALFGSRGLLI
jgi:protein-S-isoprenylcysteine O-methyltransferase Ste14